MTTGLDAARSEAAAGDFSAALCRLKAYLGSRSGALSLAQAKTCEQVLTGSFRAGLTHEARGLSVQLFGQGARDSRLILQAFSEFLDAGNLPQTHRFWPYVVRMEEPEALVEAARFHFYQGNGDSARASIRRALDLAPSSTDLAIRIATAIDAALDASLLLEVLPYWKRTLGPSDIALVQLCVARLLPPEEVELIDLMAAAQSGYPARDIWLRFIYDAPSAAQRAGSAFCDALIARYANDASICIALAAVAMLAGDTHRLALIAETAISRAQTDQARHAARFLSLVAAAVPAGAIGKGWCVGSPVPPWWRHVAELLHEVDATWQRVTDRGHSVEQLVALADLISSLGPLLDLDFNPDELLSLAAVLVPAAVRTEHLRVLRRFAGQISACVSSIDHRELALEMLSRSLPVLMDAGTLVGLEQVLMDACRANPSDPRLALVRMRMRRSAFASNDELLAILNEASPDLPGFDAAREFVALVLYIDGDARRGLELSGNVALYFTLDEASAARRAHLQLYSGLTPDVPGWATRHRQNATHRLYPTQCGEFAVALEGLRNLVNLPCRRGEAPSAEEIRRLSERALKNFTDLTRQLAVARLSDYRRTMLVLAHLADSLPGSVLMSEGHLPSISDCVWLSPECHREIRFAVHRHIVVLGLRALNGGQCASVEGSVDEIMEIAELVTASCIVLGDVQEAQRLLAAVLTHCGEMGRDFFLQLVERCDLCVPQVDPARGTVHGGLGVRANSHQLEEFENWAGSNTTSSSRQPSMRGSYSEIGGDGVLRTSVHVIDSVQADEAHMGGVQLDGPWLVLNNAGTVLKPPDWSGLFEQDCRRGHLLLNSGNHGVTLGSASRRTVSEPVLFPAGLDLPGHGGFAQWLLRGLSPICWASAHGRLDHCKLMLPQGMPRWVEQSLALCGIGEDQIVRYGAEECILVEEATILSAAGQPVAAWLDSLRILMQTGLSRSGHAQPAQQLMYLSGRDCLHRFIINEDRLRAIARAHGFQVVAPNALSVAQQVALFLGARGVVSPHRGAHASMIFAPPGTHVLVLETEFGIPRCDVDIAAVCGQSYRSLKGATEPFFHSLPSLDDAPYHVDEHLFEQQLRWVAERTES